MIHITIHNLQLGFNNRFCRTRKGEGIYNEMRGVSHQYHEERVEKIENLFNDYQELTSVTCRICHHYEASKQYEPLPPSSHPCPLHVPHRMSLTGGTSVP